MKDDSGKRLPRKKQQLSHPVTTFIGRKLPTVLLGTDLSRSDKVLARLYYRSAFVVMSWLNRQMFAIGDLTRPPAPLLPIFIQVLFSGALLAEHWFEDDVMASHVLSSEQQQQLEVNLLLLLFESNSSWLFQHTSLQHFLYSCFFQHEVAVIGKSWQWITTWRGTPTSSWERLTRPTTSAPSATGSSKKKSYRWVSRVRVPAENSFDCFPNCFVLQLKLWNW